jgi:hypothetical protein
LFNTPVNGALDYCKAARTETARSYMPSAYTDRSWITTAQRHSMNCSLPTNPMRCMPLRWAERQHLGHCVVIRAAIRAACTSGCGFFAGFHL